MATETNDDGGMLVPKELEPFIDRILEHGSLVTLRSYAIPDPYRELIVSGQIVMPESSEGQNS